MLTIHGVSQRYASAPDEVLREVSFAVDRGQTLVVTGASGSGKSSLLRILAGLESPSAGEVRWCDAPVLSPDALIPGHPAIAFLDQSSDLPPNLPVAETIKRELRRYPDAYQTQRLHELLTFCGIAHTQRLPRELSGGEQQRLALARAVARLPEVLLLDEPFAHLDYPNKTRLRQLIQDLAQRFKLTIIVVTHQIRDAFGFADHLLVLERGRIAQIDSPTTIYNRPATPEIAQLFGPTNLLPLPLLGQDYAAYPPQTLAYIPPEFISISSRGGKPAQVSASTYLGGRFLITANLLDDQGQVSQTSLHFFVQQENLQVGSHVQLQIHLRWLHTFG
ncbi:MAG: ABC transporter ATP-binding protein [Bernardetiaceae bacterium]